MTYALIGCGRIAGNHLAAAQANHLQVVALCDVNLQQAELRKQEFALPHVPLYNRHQKMLQQHPPDIVAIATWSGEHASIALDCIAAGCNVIIEKPIALCVEDADKVIAAAKQAGVLVCTCHQNRFNRSVQKVRQALEQGQFGRMFYGTAHVRWNRGEDYYRQAPWRGTWAQDGGALMNQCIHNIDLLLWMMGDEVESVAGITAQMNHPYIEAEDLGLALVRFAGSSYGLIEGTTVVYPSNLEETLYLFGETGTVKVGGQSLNRIEEWHFATGEDEATVKASCNEAPPNVYGFGHTPLYADMIDAISTHRAPLVDGEAGRRALALVLAIYKSKAMA